MIRDTETALTGRPLSPTDPLYDPFTEPYSGESEEESGIYDADDSISGGFTYLGLESESEENTDYFSGSGSDPDSMDFDFSFPLDPHDSY